MTPKLSVLVVDDDAGLREIVQRVLERAGFETFVAADSNAAAAFLESRPVDRVLLDIVLGEENGWEALRRFAARHHARVTLMTGALVDDEVRRDAQLMGAAGVLQKPFTNEDLLNALS